MFRKILLLTGLLMLFAAPYASAVTVGLVGTGDVTDVKLTNSSASFDGKLAFGGGANFNFSIGNMWSLEIGALYVRRKYGFSNIALGTKFDIEDTQAMLEVPVLIRHWFSHVISVGVGGYYGKYLGDIKIESTNTVSGTTASGSSSYASAFQKTSDMGLVASLAFDFPLGATTGLIIDGRYVHGLTNNFESSVGASTLKFSDIVGVVGLRFGTMK